MDYKEIMDMIIGELIERAFQQQRMEDENLDQLIKHHITLHDRLEQSISAFDKATKETFEDYHRISIDIDELQERYMYLQGAMDCVLLLKTLGIL